MPPLKDLIGKKFNRLTVLERDENDSHDHVQWVCECDCGNVVTVRGDHLINNHTSSCGCLNKDIRFKDLTGKRFGRLTAIVSTSKSRSGHYYWECVCDCGNHIIVGGKQLRRGYTRSCGCFQREIARDVGARAGEHLQSNYERNELKDGTALCSLTASIPKNNTSGAKGVCLRKRTGKWDVNIGFKNRKIYVGTFPNLEDAIKARKEAEAKYFEPVLNKYGRTLYKED